MKTTKKTGTKEIAETNLNWCRGCLNGCRFCFAYAMAHRFHMHPYPRIPRTGRWEDMEVLDHRDLEIPYNTTCMISSTHDQFPEMLPALKEVLHTSLQHNNLNAITTKPRLAVIQPLLDEFTQYVHYGKIEFWFTITAVDQNISRKYEPNAPLPEERLECLSRALAAKFPTKVLLEPYLQDPRKILETLEDWGIRLSHLKEIWVGVMRPYIKIPAELRPLYTKDHVAETYQTYAGVTNLRWKDTIRKILQVKSTGEPLLQKA